MVRTTSTQARTEDDAHIETILDWLPSLMQLSQGPELDPQRLEITGGYPTADIHLEDIEGTGYYDHYHKLRSWMENVKNALNCEYQFEEENILNWDEEIATESRRTSDDGVLDGGDAYMHFRLLDTRGNVPLFEIQLDYYITGAAHVSLELTPGYKTTSAMSGGRSFDSWYPIDDYLTNARGQLGEIVEEIRDKKPYVVSRVEQLVDSESAKWSHAIAIALSETGLDTGEISKRMGVSEGTVRGYKSKFNSDTQAAERRIVAEIGLPKRILAEHEFGYTEYDHETAYVCRAISNVEQPYVLIRVQAGREGMADINISTDTYETLTQLIEKTYENTTFIDTTEAQEVYELLNSLPTRLIADTDYDDLSSPEERIRDDIP